MEVHWGSSLWSFLHLSSYIYTEDYFAENKDVLEKFVSETLGRLLPCPDCRLHYEAYIEFKKKKGVLFSTQRDYQIFLVDLHNSVNSRLGKRLVSLEEADAMYKNSVCCTVLKPRNYVGKKFKLCLIIMLVLAFFLFIVLCTSFMQTIKRHLVR